MSSEQTYNRILQSRRFENDWLIQPRNITTTERRDSTVLFKCALKPNANKESLLFTWWYNSAPVEENTKFSISTGDDGFSSTLTIHNPETIDSGYYRCDTQDNLISATGILQVLPGDNSLDYEELDSEVTDDEFSHNVYFVDDVESRSFCEPYRGSVCSEIIGRRMIFVTTSTQQDATEKQLSPSSTLDYFLHRGTHVTEECGQSVLFLACIYAFPLCNDQSQLISNKLDTLDIVRARQLCRADCNYVNDIACKSLSKDPYSNILSKLKLPTCAELPPASSHADCVSFSYLRNAEPNAAHLCFNKTGKLYRGLVAHSASGKPCLPWISVTSKKEYKHLSYIYHAELGNHQYCRNPHEDLIHQSPWCFVQSSSLSGNVGIVQETCNVPKCGGLMESELWMIVVPSVFIPIGLALLLIFTYLLCCKRRGSSKHQKDYSVDKRGHYYQSNSFGSFGPLNKKSKKFFSRSNSSGQPITTNSLNADQSFEIMKSHGENSLFSVPNSGQLIIATGGTSVTPLLASHNGDLMLHQGGSTSNGRRSAGGNSNQTNESRQSSCKDIHQSQFQYIKEVGEGRFGVCYIAELNESFAMRNAPLRIIKRQCFAKTLNEIDLLDQFLVDCNALTSKPPKHVNLACLIGLCQEPPSAFFEYLPFDLHEVLVKHRKTGPNSSHFNARLSPVLEKIVVALSYLSSRKIVHRDIAARNVLLNKEYHPNQIKLCDFASCRSIYINDYYRVGGSMLPVRWMSPESVLTGTYSAQSDIWSFGVLIWEFCSGGRRPHDGATNPEVVEGLRDRKLLSLPTSSVGSSSSDQQNLSILRGVMLECWACNPNHRPYASDLIVRLKNLIDCNLMDHYSDDQNHRQLPLDTFQFKV